MADDAQPSPPGQAKTVNRALAGGAAAIVIAGALQVALPLATSHEGYVAKAKPDPVGITTYCYGETQSVDPSRIYGKTECAVKLRTRMARDYAPIILKCVPGFIDPARRNMFGAALDGSYNAGPGGFCSSPMAKAFNAGAWLRGCDLFVGWRETGTKDKPDPRYKSRRLANGKWSITYPGLVDRRADERHACRGEKWK